MTDSTSLRFLIAIKLSIENLMRFENVLHQSSLVLQTIDTLLGLTGQAS